MRAWVAGLAAAVAWLGAASAADVRFRVENTTGQPIREVLASASRSGAWGQNLIAAPIPPGATVEVNPSSAECRIDVLLVFGPRQEEQRFKMDGCAHPTVRAGQPAPPGDDPSFELINGAQLPIRELYVAPNGQLATAFDLLVTGPLANNASTWVSLLPSGGCMQDIRLIYADGTSREWTLVETCNVRDLTFR